MGSDSLIDDVAGLRSWLRGLPSALSTDAALAELGAIAGGLARALGVGAPRALPASEPIDLPPALAYPDLLGIAWETLMAPADRRSQGAHFTPPHVADEIVALALACADTTVLPRVWDPTCGGGAFLLAAARALRAGGHDPAEIVRSCHGTDIDPIALRVTDASLELWCGGAARPQTAVVDVLLHDPHEPALGTADVVIGNPPFLSQLMADTARSADRRAALVDRFGEVAHGYVDDAGLIAVAAADHAAADAVVALVMPQSLLGARDAHGVRSALTRGAALVGVWVETGGAFDASVDVVAPILHRGAAPDRTTVHHGDRTIDLAQPDAASWARVLAAADGVPVVEPAGERRLGELATVTAGFRQHFYGLQGAVREAELDEVGPRLVTSGAIEPLWSRWGARPVRFGGTSWTRPIVDLDQVEDSAVAEWFSARRVPKLLVASQTRVIEVIVDEAGTLLPSVPVISVEPDDPADLWRLAALLTSPIASATIATSSAGTGLSRAALRIRAADLASLALPANDSSWSTAAEAARAAQVASREERWDDYRTSLRTLGEHMTAAHGSPPNASVVVDWWCDRIRFPEETEGSVE